MYVLAMIVMLVSAVGFLSAFTGLQLPVLSELSLGVWVGVFAVSFVVAMWTRRPSN